MDRSAYLCIKFASSRIAESVIEIDWCGYVGCFLHQRLYPQGLSYLAVYEVLVEGGVVSVHVGGGIQGSALAEHPQQPDQPTIIGKDNEIVSK